VSAEAVQVVLAKTTEASRLYPHLLKRPSHLTLESRLTQFVTNQIEVYAQHGEVLLGVDSNRVLADVEVHYGKRWNVRSDIVAPHPSRSADLRFSDECVKQGDFHIPVEVVTNENRSCAVVFIGLQPENPKAVSLSKYTAALLDGDRLAGFYVDLRDYKWW
jgi:hypothetical protein